MKRNIMICLLSFALLLSLCPGILAVEDRGEAHRIPEKGVYSPLSDFDPGDHEELYENGYRFVIYEEGAVIIGADESVSERVAVDLYSSSVVTKVPDTLGGVPVTAVWEYAFRNLWLGQLQLPDTVRWIEDYAFAKANGVSVEKLPNQLEYVGDYGFSYADFTQCTIPETLRYIGKLGFKACKFGKTEFGNSLEYIGQGAFWNCSFQDKRVVLPESLSYAGYHIFRQAFGSYDIEVTVLSRDLYCPQAFEYTGCVWGYSGSSVEASCDREGIPFYDLETGELHDTAYEKRLDHVTYRITSDHAEVIATYDADKLKTLAVADHVDGKPVTVLNTNCLGSSDLASLEILLLPDTVTEIESHAIYDCENLHFIHMSNSLKTAEEGMIESCYALLFVKIPSSFTEFLIYDDVYDDGLFEHDTNPYIGAVPGSFASQFCSKYSDEVLSIREDRYYVADTAGVYETDGKTARIIAMMGGGNYYNPYRFPDTVYGIPVTTIAGNLRYATYDPKDFGHEIAVVGDEVRVVEDGAFSRSYLRYIYFGPNVEYLPYPLFYNGAEQHDHAVCGYSGSYVEEYCKKYGYRFLPVDSAPFEDISVSDWYNEAVSYCYWAGLMNGVSEDRFAPNDTTTRAMVAKVLYNLSGQQSINGWSYGFKDVSKDDWFYYAVNWCSYYGITKGTDAFHFSPNKAVTREQLVTLFHRYARACNLTLTEGVELKEYTDRGQISAYALEAMEWAVAVGLLRGRTNTTLVPQGHATRAEIATILMRFVQYVETLKA